MIDNIKSTKVKKVNEAYNYAGITEKELNYMSEFDDAELAEFLFLIDQSIISYNVLAYYFVVYDKATISRIEKTYQYDFINELLASAWMDNFQDKDANLIFEMLMGLSIINTDLINRIRKGCVLNAKKLNSFDLKVEEIIKELMVRSENGTLYKTLTTVDSDDYIALKEEDNQLFLHIKNDLDNLSNVFELYNLIHGLNKTREYLGNDNKKIAKYEEDLRNKIKGYFKVEDLKLFSYLPECYKEIILGTLTGTTNLKETETKNFTADKKDTRKPKRKPKDRDILESISTMEREDEPLEPVLNTSEDKLFGAVDKMVNGKRTPKRDDKVDNSPLGCHDIFVGMDEKRPSSPFSGFFKVLFATFSILAVIGWGLSVRSNNTSGTDHLKNLTYQQILSYKLSSGENAKFDMKVNRVGTGNTINGTVKDNTPNIE